MLSISQVLLVVAVAGAVIAAGRLLRGNRNAATPAEPRKPAADDTTAVDLERCDVCGQYFASGTKSCERADCPHAA